MAARYNASMSSDNAMCPTYADGLYGLLVTLLLAVASHIVASARRGSKQSSLLSELLSQLSTHLTTPPKKNLPSESCPQSSECSGES